MPDARPDSNDALPYIDTVIDDDESAREAAMQLVDDELEVYPPDEDYLKHLPSINRTFLTSLIEHEHAILEAGTPRELESDQKDMNIDIPPPFNSDMCDEELQLWNKCLNQAKVKLEYLQRQAMNIDLVKNYGAAVWQRCLAEKEALDGCMQAEIEDLTTRTQKVNWTRKTDQEKVGRTLEVLKNEWNRYVDKNKQLSREIASLKMKNATGPVE